MFLRPCAVGATDSHAALHVGCGSNVYITSIVVVIQEMAMETVRSSVRIAGKSQDRAIIWDKARPMSTPSGVPRNYGAGLRDRVENRGKSPERVPVLYHREGTKLVGGFELKLFLTDSSGFGYSVLPRSRNVPEAVSLKLRLVSRRISQ